jgi:hypothetical protein
VAGENKCPSATLLTINSTYTTLGLNMSLWGEKPPTTHSPHIFILGQILMRLKKSPNNIIVTLKLEFHVFLPFSEDCFIDIFSYFACCRSQSDISTGF